MKLGLSLAMTSALALMSAGPVADFNFQQAALPAGISFSRASVATDVIGGVLTQFASGQPRISSDNGLLIEESRTNNLRNGDCTGATAGVVGSGGALPTSWVRTTDAGVTMTVNSTGVENGFPYVEINVAGTTAATSVEVRFDGPTQVVAATGQNWSGSFYMKEVGGDKTNITQVNCRTTEIASGSTVQSTNTNITASLNNTIQRFSASRLFNDATTTHALVALRFVYSIGVAINYTFRLYAPQLEQGAVPTSYIPTTGSAAVTRQSDLVEVLNPSGFIAQGVGTWFYDAVCSQYGYDTSLTINTRVFDINPLDTNNTMGANRSFVNSRAGATCSSGGVQQWALSPPTLTWPLGTELKGAVRYDAFEAAFCYTGSPLNFDTTIPNGIPTLTQIYVGRRTNAVPNGGWLNGYIRRLRYWNHKLSDADMLAAVA